MARTKIPTTFVVTLLFLLLASWALASPPAWKNRYGPLVSPEEARAVLPPFAPLVGSGAETEITPEIQALARGLRHDPRLIYEFARNEIEFIPMYGSVKGATGTLLDKAGNSFDQSALMIALLRESGYTASFLLGQVRYTGAQISSWLGIGTDPDVVGQVIGSAGIPASIFVTGSSVSRVEMEHVWVKVNIDGTDYVFDPSFTLHHLSSKIDLETALGYDQATFVANATAGATIDPDFIENTNRANIHADLATFSGNLVSHLRTQIPGAKLEEVIGGMEILPVRNQGLRTTLSYELSRDFEWVDFPAAWETTLRLEHLGIDHTFSSSEIYGKRLTVFTNLSNQPEVRLDGVLIATGTPATPGSFNPITLTVDHPYAAGGGTYGDQLLNSSLESGSSYVIANSWAGTSRAIVDKHKRIVTELNAAGADPLGEELLGETLSVLALSWLAEVSSAVDLTDGVASTHTIKHHTVGFTGQRSSPFIDIPLSLVSVISLEENQDRADAAFFVGGGIASAMEWGIFDQLQPISAVSTVKLMDISNAKGDKQFDVTSANWDTVQPQLVNYSSGEISTIEFYVFAGFRLILPEDGDLTEDQWTGMGFIAISPSENSIAHIISGGLSGGEGTEPGDADPVTASEVKEALQTILHELSNEPIDLVSGHYLHDHVDLTLGSGDYPFAMGFRRYYSSANKTKDGPLGLGWTHNFAIRVNPPASDPFQGMGEDSPIDAAPAIAEIFAALDLLETPTSKETLVIGTLSHRWFMDRLIDNLVVIEEARAQWPFVLLPDGSYSPPPGSADLLTVEPDTSFRLRSKKGIVFDFDLDGKIETWSDPNGNTVTFAYTADELMSVTNGMSRTLSFAWTDGRITQVDDGTGRSAGYTYDGDGNLATYSDPLTHATTYEYDEPGRLTRVFRPANPLDPNVTNVYDSLDRVETQTDARSNTWQYFFADGRRAEEEAAGGDVRIWYFDRLGQTTLEIDPLGDETQFEYDGAKRLVRVDYPLFNSVEYEYDAIHNPTRVTVNPQPISSLDPKILAHTYDPIYSRILTTTEQGTNPRTTTFTYDASGNVIQVERPAVNAVVPTLSFTYTSRGQVETYTDPRGMVTRYTYDALTGDRLSAVADDGGLNVTTTLTYDAVGNLASITDPRGGTTTYVWDDRRDLTQITSPAPFLYQTLHTYDENGNLTSISRSTGVPADPWQVTSMTYNLADKLATETDPDSNVTQFEYDVKLRLSRKTDAQLNPTDYAYDALDRVVSVTDGRGVVIEEYTYTENGLTASLEDGNDNVTLFEWDGFDRLDRIEYPDTSFEEFTYDEFNNVATKRLRSGDVATFTYDRLNRITSSVIPGTMGTSVQYAYDLNGSLTSATDWTGVTSYSYDPLNRLLDATYPGLGTVRNDFDAAGNRTRLEHPDGYFVTYEYDSLHRMTDILEAGTSLLTHYDWDDLSRRAGIARGNGTSTVYTFDPSDDLHQVFHQFASATLPVDYTYDFVGNRVSRTTPANSAAYQYDDAYQLTQVLNLVGPPLQVDTVYDDAGNRMTVTEDGSPVGYVTNGLNQYTDVGGVAYTYDARGNLISRGTTAYTYDAEDRLRIVETPDLRSVYTYDAFGRRATKRVDSVQTVPEDAPDSSVRALARGHLAPGKVFVPGATTTYLYDETQVIAEIDAQGQIARRFVYGDRIDEPIAMIAGPDLYHYHADALGSVVAITDATGDPVEIYDYDATGVVDAPSALGNPYLFTGRRHDAETGLYYYRARYYDPAIGRFVQPDSGGYADGMNLYSYVHNNPANRTDPSGEWALIDNLIAGAVGAVGGVVGQGVSDLITGDLSSWETYVGSAAGGVVAAEVMLHTGNPWLAGAAGGEVSSVTKQGLENISGYISTGEWKGFDAGDVVQSTVLGGVTGGVLNKVKLDVPGITSGRNSYGAIYKQIMTKLNNGTIKNVSNKTILKMLAYEGVSAVPSTLLGGEIDGIKRGIEQILKNK